MGNEEQRGGHPFFDHIQALTALLKKSQTRDVYEGKLLRRLLDQRWSGHHDAVVSFLANKNEIREMLETLSSSGESEISRGACYLRITGEGTKVLEDPEKTISFPGTSAVAER